MGIKVHEGCFFTEEREKLFYLVRGSGLPVIFCNGIGVASESFWPSVCQPLSETVQTINWDYLAHGHSAKAKDPTKMSISLLAQHLALLMDELELEQAVIAGHSMGVQVGFEFYRQFPERVLALIPTLGTYGHPFDNFLRYAKSAEIFDKISQEALQHPAFISTIWPHLIHSLLAQPFSRIAGFVHPTLCSRHELDIYLAHLKSFSPETFFYLARDMQNHSGIDLLEKIDVPTLILAGEKDIFTPIEASYEMHEKIKGSELLVVREGTHTALAEQPELFWLRIERFLATYFPEQVKRAEPQFRS